MKKALWIPLSGIVILVAAFIGLRSCQQRFWESTLDGPFTGAAYSGSITTAPASLLIIPEHGQLEAYELPSSNNPVVLLRSFSGDIQWSRQFMPERKRQDGIIEHAALRDLRFQSWEKRSSGSVVFFTCDWDWGGREGGLIELDSTAGFKHFSLSW